MKYVLIIIISVMMEDGTYSDPFDTFVNYKTQYDCLQGAKAVKVIGGTLKQGGAKLKLTVDCRKKG